MLEYLGCCIENKSSGEPMTLLKIDKKFQFLHRQNGFL